MDPSPSTTIINKYKKLLEHVDKELSFRKILHGKYSVLFEFSSISAISLAVIITVIIPFWDNHPKWLLWSIPILSLLSLIFLFSYLYACYNHAKNESSYSSYAATLKFSIFPNFDEFLFAYRVDKLKEYIQDEGITDTECANFTELFEKSSSRLRERFWKPFALVALIVLPIWNEFVGKQMGEGLPGWGIIILSAFLLTYFVLLSRKIFEVHFLSKANKQERIAEYLKMIKMMS